MLRVNPAQLMGYHRWMLRAILFDFNGVLVDDEPLHLELFQKVLAEEGIELTAEDYYAHYLAFNDRDCFTAALAAARAEATPERLSHLIERKAAYYQTRVDEQGFPPYPGGPELIAEAAGAGLMLGIVSGALKAEVEGALKQLGVRSRFKTVVAAEDVEQGKPHPAGYRRGLENLNTLPPVPTRPFEAHEVLAIEDSPAGLEAAVACGLATLGVAQTYPAERLAGAGSVVESIDGLTLDRLRALFAEAREVR